MQPFRRATEVQLLGDSNKVPQVAQLEIPIHIANIIIDENKILDVMDVKGETVYVRLSYVSD